MKNSLLVFGTKNFNNSLNEIKEYFNFSLVFFEKNNFSKSLITNASAILIESDFCNNDEIFSLINSIRDKPVLLFANQTSSDNKCNHNKKIFLPLNFKDLSRHVKNLITSVKFNQNSSIKIKEYLIDKNERKLTKGNLSLTITEREIELIEVLFNEPKPLSKIEILKKIWKYAEGVNTHTIETHIYRLRKKILDKFKDDNFIINSKTGYSV